MPRTFRAARGNRCDDRNLAESAQDTAKRNVKSANAATAIDSRSAANRSTARAEARCRRMDGIAPTRARQAAGATYVGVVFRVRQMPARPYSETLAVVAVVAVALVAMLNFAD